MPIKKDSIFNSMFDLGHPWSLNVVSYSKHLQEIYLQVDYDSKTLNCPICGKTCSVISKTPLTLQYLDCFQFKSFMICYLPLIRDKCCCDQAALNDVILLNLILNQLRNTDVLSPLRSFYP